MATIDKKPGIAAWEGDTFTEEELITGDTPAIVTEAFTLADQNAVLPAYSVVGKISTGGKLTLSDSGASDGSEDAFGITGFEAPDVGGDQSITIYRAGCFNPARLNWHASYSTDALKKEAFRVAAPMIVIKPIV